jgi:serine/threonine protein kinase/Tol biopolymer transport system component
MPEFIAHYRIGSKLGQGAMGEVYRATDTKLGRDVAIKLISPALTENQSRLASFTREAQLLASLNHPNIAAIYGVEDQALVMELVEGPTLADRIKQGPIPLEEALRIARQIAEGLAAAHDRGIVHRDLKPANIKLTADGTVKLLDFGLAKAAAVAAVGTDEAATVAVSMVGGDMIVGTPAYMAPEQARGLPLDRRADIWAFGVVLYEMLTGTALFKGDTLTDVMAAVVREEPDLTRVPASLRPFLSRCLAKDPKRRLRDAGDAVLLLETAGEAPAVEKSRTSGVRAWLPWAAAAAAVIAFGVVLAVHLRETPPLANTVRFNLTLPPEVTTTQTSPFSISPDGRNIAFPAIGVDNVVRIWLQPLDALEPRPLEAAVSPSFDVLVWAPDSGSLLYAHDQKLKRVGVNGGAPTVIASLQSGGVLGTAWHENGTILFGTVQGIMRTDESGATPTLVTKADVEKGVVHGVFDLLPDGRHFLYSVGAPRGQRSVSVGSLDATPEAQDTSALLKTDFGAVFVPGTEGANDGHLIFLDGGTALAQPFDATARKTTGEPRPVADNVFNFDRQIFGIPFFSISTQGTLVYRRGTLADNLARQLAWVGRDGNTQKTLAELGRYNQVKLSPDSTKVVTSRTVLETGANADLWVTDLATETSTKLTFGGGANIQPVWSPDGRFVAWVGRRGDDGVLFRKPADGSGGEEVLYRYVKNTGNIGMSDWTPGQMLVYSRGGDVFALPVGSNSAPNREPIAVVQSPANEFGASVSPDGRWIAYVSNESGRQEVYVQPFVVDPKSAADAASRPKWLVSRGSVGMVRWRADSRELMFLGADGSVMSVDVTGTPVFKASAPRALFQLPRSFTAQLGTPGALADTAPDLQRLIIAVPSEAGRRQSLSVVLNWQNAERR